MIKGGILIFSNRQKEILDKAGIRFCVTKGWLTDMDLQMYANCRVFVGNNS